MHHTANLFRFSLLRPLPLPPLAEQEQEEKGFHPSFQRTRLRGTPLHLGGELPSPRRLEHGHARPTQGALPHPPHQV